MNSAVFVLLFACAAYGMPQKDLNVIVDQFLLKYNGENRAAGLGVLPVPDADLGPISYKNSFKVGLDSIHRIGDCSAEDKDKVQSFKCLLGFGLLQFVCGELTIDGSKMTASTKVKNNSFQFEFTVEKDGCKVNLEKYEFVDFGDFEFSSSLEEFDGQPVPKEVSDTLKQYVNTVLKTDEKKKQVEEALGKSLCSKV